MLHKEIPVLHVIDIVQIWVTPFLVVFGCVGNLVSVWVFHSSKLRTLSSSAPGGPSSIGHSLPHPTSAGVAGRVRLQHLQPLGRLSGHPVYISYCSTFLSVWFVVAFTVERFIAVCFPCWGRPSVPSVGPGPSSRSWPLSPSCCTATSWWPSPWHMSHHALRHRSLQHRSRTTDLIIPAFD